MLRRVQTALLALIAIVGLCTPLWAETVDAGTIRLPKAIEYGSRTLEKGSYKVMLSDSADGPTVVLASKQGEPLVAELAIVLPSKSNARKPRAWAARTHREEKFVKIVVTSGKMRYLAYFEITD
jgi:hypothetical protein